MSESNTEGWRELADQLHKKGGIPKRRAEVVALKTKGHSHQEVCNELGFTGRGNVTKQLDDYEDDRTEAEWLAKNGPEV